MADMMDTLKEMLGDDAEDKINAVMSMLGGAAQKADSGAVSSATPSQPDPVSDGSFSPELLMQAQQLISRLSSAGGDNRSNLLMSLKPYMRKERKQTIDNAVKLLNIAQLSQLFKGGI